MIVWKGGGLWEWVLVGVEGLLRVVSVFGGGAGGVVWLEAGWVFFLRRVWVLGTC